MVLRRGCSEDRFKNDRFYCPILIFFNYLLFGLYFCLYLINHVFFVKIVLKNTAKDIDTWTTGKQGIISLSVTMIPGFDVRT